MICKKILITIGCIAALGLICLGGCRYLLGKESSNGKDDKAYKEFKFPEEIKYKSEHLNIDCKLDIPKDIDYQKLQPVKAHTIIFSDYSDKIYSTFSASLKNTEYSKEEVHDDAGIRGTQKIWQRIDSKTGIADFLNLFVSSIYYTSSANPGIYDSVLRENEYEGAYDYFPSGFQYNANMFLKELSFASVADVKKSIDGQFEKWGFESGFDYEFLGVSKDLVLSQYCYLKPDDDTCVFEPSKDELNRFKECYQIYARQTLKGLPVIYYTSDGILLYRECSPVQITYSADGIVYMTIDRMLMFDKADREDGQGQVLASEKQIMDTLTQRFDEIITDNSFEIKRGGLYYYAFGNGNKRDFEMIPVWAFVVRETHKNTDEVYESMFLIDAVTGKEMPYEP